MANWGSFAQGLAGGIQQGQLMGFNAQKMALMQQKIKEDEMDMSVKQDIASYAQKLSTNPDYQPQTTPQSDYETGQIFNVTRPALKNPENDVLAYGIKAYQGKGMLKQADELGKVALQRFQVLSAAAAQFDDPALKSKLVLEGLIPIAPALGISVDEIRKMQSGTMDSEEMKIINGLNGELQKITADLSNPNTTPQIRAELFARGKGLVSEARTKIGTKRQKTIDEAHDTLNKIYDTASKAGAEQVGDPLIDVTLPDGTTTKMKASVAQKFMEKPEKPPMTVGQNFVKGYTADIKSKHPDWNDAQVAKAVADEAQRQGIDKSVTVAVMGSEARGRAFANERFYSMFDTSIGQTIKVKGNALNQDTTNRYLDPQDPNVKADTGSLVKITKGMDSVNAFEKGATNALTYAESVATDFNTGKFPGINKVSQLFQFHAGNEKVKGLRNAITTAATEYMKVINAGSDLTAAELSVMGQQRAKEIIESSDNLDSLKNSMKIMKREMQISGDKFKAQQREIKGRLKNYGVETPLAAGGGFDLNAINAELARRKGK